ncbi:TRAP transporter permease [Roseospira goensis]|uniref:TRAP transporter 4TM/12TM fusion protein n=1 Tax=Roseospira goensis TaxID=391922 RepID=A0A7W6RYX9_9PROT|nr:TRAP transporter fused permease subunit [Roseospira goensis]MBB4285174.1 TRAP transporter 4TM/12TM fusion protein [Roseospira goensis]
MSTQDTTAPTLEWGWRGDGRLSGAAWFAALVLSTAGFLVVVNQIFNLGAFGFRPISTGYYYLLIALFLAVAFLSFPGARRDAHHVRWYDWLLAGLTLAVGGYLAWNATNIISRGWDLLAPDLPTAVAGALVLLALEGVRRCGGLPLLIICAVFAVYPLFAGSMPGVLWGSQYTLAETARAHAMGVESIIGIPMRVVSDLLIGFILFGVALVASGGGEFFMRLATALLGGTRGGPAKVAILSSGFFGSLSGSVISNVISTGAMTIPTMKRCGYPASYAGAVEACASTGGALMPPVMGAVAFIMASFLNVPYVDIMVAAAVPAILFYLILLLQADAFAARTGLTGLPRDQIPSLVATLRAGWIYLFSLGLLVTLLIGFSIESKAPFYASALLVVTAMLLQRGTGRIKVVANMMVEVGKNISHLIGILAGIGLIVGALSITGVGNAFSRELVQYAGDNVFLMLVLGALTSFILGMGMTVSACYIFLAIVLAPALIQSGLDRMASHMFILYWGMLSYITPPVALAAVAAAGIANAPAMATGMKAMRLGLVLFILPFLFVYNPALILNGTTVDVAVSVATAAVAVWMLSSAFERYLYFAGTLRAWHAVVLLAGGLALMMPEHRTDAIGLLALLMVYGERLMVHRRHRRPAA